MSNLKNIFKKVTLVSVASAAMLFSSNALAYRDFSVQLNQISAEITYLQDWVTYCYSHGMDCYSGSDPVAQEKVFLDQIDFLKEQYHILYESQWDY